MVDDGLRLVIANPCAGGGRMADALAAWSADGGSGWRVVETESSDHARELARQAASGGAECVVAAGGDGTVHDVVQGLMRGAEAETRPVLGVLPCGTANDFSRAIGLNGEWVASVAAIDGGATRPIDVVKVTGASIEGGERVSRYIVNAATGGLSVAIDEAMDETIKQWWGPFSYARVAAEVLPTAESFRVKLTVRGGETVEGEALAVLVANGPRAGGVELAPRAELGDGRLDVAVAHGATWDQRAGLLADFAQGRAYASERIEWRWGERVDVEAEPAMGFIGDGERLGTTPMTFELLGGALRVLTAG